MVGGTVSLYKNSPKLVLLVLLVTQGNSPIITTQVGYSDSWKA